MCDGSGGGIDKRRTFHIPTIMKGEGMVDEMKSPHSKPITAQ